MSEIDSTQAQALPTNPLHQLRGFPGKWKGTGFNMIALPTTAGGFRLKLSKTAETLEFTDTGVVPNRGGLDQPDISLEGLTYLQNVNEVQDDGNTVPIHVEPGIWMFVPASKNPKLGDTIVRLATIPHGNSVLAQSLPGNFGTLSGPPTIEDINTVPHSKLDGSPLRIGYTDAYLNPLMPAGIERGVLINPNFLLQQTIKGQNIISTDFITITTETTGGGVSNIPFLQQNADVPRVSATFWLETVQNADGNTFQQLQYSQTVILRFLDIDWPHVSVATLVRAD